MASNFVNGINILDTTNSSGVNSGGSLNVRGGASFSKDIYIGGNVNISGTTTAFSDNIILINQNPINSTDTGFLFERFSEDISNDKKYSGIIYSETNDQYVFAYLQDETQRGSVTTNGFIGIQSENLTLNSTQNSSGVGTGGSLNVLGGGSISKDLHIGGNIYNNGNIIGASADSQWGLINNNLYYTTGNVGIGTTSPSHKLDVNGTINATTFTGASVSVTNITTGIINTINEVSTNITTGTIITTNEISTNITTTSLLTSTLNASTGITSGASHFSSLFVTGGSLNATFNSNTIGSIITTAGNVGIGTSSPESKLHVNGSITLDGETASYNSSNTDIGNRTQTYITFKPNGTVDDWAYLRQIGGVNNYLMSLDIHDDGDEAGFCIRSVKSTDSPDTINERFRVQANGNVGIGTSSPNAKLDIRTSSTSEISLLNFRNEDQYGIYVNSPAVNSRGNALRFLASDYNANSPTTREVLYLSPTGNVGIGTTSPSTGFGGTINNVKLALISGTPGQENGTSTILIGGDANHYSSITSQHIGSGLTYLSFGTCTTNVNPTEKMRITASGNIGIGTTSPVQMLHLKRSGSNNYIKIDAGNTTSNYSGIMLTEDNIYWGYSLRHNALTDLLHISLQDSTPNFTDILTFNRSGNVGIGTTSPNAKLEIRGSPSNNNNYTTPESILRLGRSTGNWFGSSMEFMVYSNASGYSMVDINLGVPNSENPQELALRAGNGTIFTNLNVGIGNIDPTYPLRVTNTYNNIFSTGLYLGTTSLTAYTSGNTNCSIFADGSIVSSLGFYTVSDSRIKNNINDINDNEALEKLRLLQPKSYKYIDKIKRGNSTVYGFIAEQVEQVIPYAVSTIKEFIPNIYDKANFTVGNILQLHTLTSINLYTTENATNRIKLYDNLDNEIIVTLKNIISNNSFEIEEELPNNEYFVYGQEINDFKSLNKDLIWAISTSAIQQIDRELQNEKQQHLETKQRLDNLETFIKSKFPGEI